MTEEKNEHEHEQFFFNRGKIENNYLLCTLCTVRMPNEFKCRSFHSKCKRNKKGKKTNKKRFEPLTIQL